MKKLLNIFLMLLIASIARAEYCNSHPVFINPKPTFLSSVASTANVADRLNNDTGYVSSPYKQHINKRGALDNRTSKHRTASTARATLADTSTTVAGLRALTNPQTGALYQTTDFGTGNWYYSSATGQTDNTGTIIVNTNTGGYFKRIYAGNIIYADWFGVDPTGVNDSFTAMQNAINWIHTAYPVTGGTIILGAETIYLNYPMGGGLMLYENQPITIQGQNASTVIKLSRNVPMAFQTYYNGDSSSQHLFKNITLQNFNVDRQNINAAAITPLTAISGSYSGSGSGTYVTVNVGSNASFLPYGYVFFPYSDTPSTVAGKSRKFRILSGSTTSIQVLLAAGDIINNIHNNNQVEGICQDHVIFGDYVDGEQTITYNASFDSLTIKNIHVLNAPPAEPNPTVTGLTNTSATMGGAVVLLAIQAAERGISGGYSGSLYATNIDIENVSMSGLNNGFGIYSTNLTVPFFTDNVIFRDCYHDTGITPPNQYNSYGILVGGQGYGNHLLIQDCTSENSGDVGFEPDGQENALILNAHLRDAYGSGIFQTNYNIPATTISGAPSTTINQSGGIGTADTTVTVTSIPANIPVRGYIVIDDDELCYYTYTSGSTLSIYRGLNGTPGISHLNGAPILFFQQTKQFTTVRDADISSDLSGNNVGAAVRQSRNWIIPSSNLILKNIVYNRKGTQIGRTGEALEILGENGMTDIDGFMFNIDGINCTFGGQTGATINFQNPDYGTFGNNNPVPKQYIKIRNINGEVSGILNSAGSDTSSYSIINPMFGNFFIDWSKINLTCNLLTNIATETHPIFFWNATEIPMYLTGAIDNYKLTTFGDAAPDCFFIRSSVTVNNLNCSNFDYSDLGQTVTSNNSNYLPFRPMPLANTFFRNIVPPKTATTPIANNYGNVTSANSDISVSNTNGQTILTVNSGNGPDQLLKLDASADIVATGQIQTSGLFTNNRAGTGTTVIDGYLTQNTNLATSTSPVQYSMRNRQRGSAWNTTNSTYNNIDFATEVRPTSGATTSGNLYWTTQNNLGGYIDIMNLSASGVLTPAGGVSLSKTAAIVETDASGNYNTSIKTTTFTSNHSITVPDETGQIGIILARGQTTLSSGTQTISISGVTSTSKVFLSFVSVGGTVSTTWQYAGVATSNHITITALTSSGLTNTADSSTLNYTVTN
jgi:hypothetical protein